MSNPQNRLSTFRSYSYYHVIAMCDSSDTADKLAASTELNVWDHATASTAVPDERPNTPGLGPYSPKQLAGSGKYIILINGSTDAAYTIEQAHWTSATGAQAVPGDRATSIATEGSIRISEPKGVAFLDQVVRCCVALGVDSAQVVYVMKTFFVGTNQFLTGDKQDFNDVITDIPPVTFIVYDITGAFTEAGGSYDLQFVAAGHGASRLPQYSSAVNAMSVTAGDSLETTLRRLQDNINASYDKYFKCVYDQIKAVSTDNTDLLDSLCRVNYVIEVGDDYKDTNGIKYTVTNQPQQYKNGASCADPAQVTFPPHTSIENAISTIMQMSTQVQSDMAVGDTSNKLKYEYKIHTALVSTPQSDDKGTIKYTVYYRVERFLSPKSAAFDAFQKLSQDQSQLEKDPAYAALKQNIIEFDYIYTGKNIDILEFDMKVNMGMAYLQTATLANTMKSQLERGPNRVMQPSQQDVSSSKFGGVGKRPIFFGSQIRTPALTNTQNAGHAIQSAYTLTKHSSLEVTDVTMRITGNTELLGTTNRTTSPTYVVDSAKRSTQPTPADNQAGFADWTHAPAFVKVKIMMPRENDDFSLFTGQNTNGDLSSTDYARDFWYDGYYYVVGIDHVFDGGEFSQTLQLLGLPKASTFESTKDHPSPDQNLNTSVGTCFDNQIGNSAPSQPTAPTVSHTPPAGDTTPTNKADANTTNNVSTNSGDPSCVRGWDGALDEVKRAIIAAANRYGVDVVTMAQFACQESSFKPQNTASPLSSATGLYQFLQSTWNDMVDKGQVSASKSTQATHTGSGHNWQKPTAADPRMDAATNALGGAAFMSQNAKVIGSSSVGDLYLAHFMGAGTAKKIIATDNAGQGSTLLSSALGADAFAKVKSANPTIIHDSTTVSEIRTWAATTMAKTLKKGVEVARQTVPTPPAAAAGAPVATTQPSPPDTKRTADQAVAAQQNAAAQSAKSDVQPCNKGPDTSKEGIQQSEAPSYSDNISHIAG